jgi:hypothetical protein
MGRGLIVAAVHCIIDRVPFSILADDVRRMIPYDKKIDSELPLVEGPPCRTRDVLMTVTRLYEKSFKPTKFVLLRFQKPVELQRFLAQVPTLSLLGSPIHVRILFSDADLSADRNYRPGRVYPRQVTLESLLSPREPFFRDSAPKTQTTLVELQGLPQDFSMGGITFTMRKLMRDERFGWAYEWRNPPGGGAASERNAVPIAGEGREGRSRGLVATRRWVFALSDRVSAWNFARYFDGEYFREDLFKKKYLVRARVRE